MQPPGYLAKIIHRRDLGCCRNVGKAHLIPSEPASLVRQVADIAHMIAQIGTRRAQPFEVGAAGRMPGKSRIELLVQKLPGNLAMKLAVEPIDQPPHLGTFVLVARKERYDLPVDWVVLDVLAEILGDRIRAADGGTAVGLEHRQFPGRIEREKFGAPFPRPLLREAGLYRKLGQRDADRARERTQPVMGELVHVLTESPRY